MKVKLRKSVSPVSFVLIGVVAAMVLQPLGVGAQQEGNSGFIRRFAANFTTFGDPAELVTDAQPLPNAEGGTVINNEDFFTANDINVLYIQISAVGDTHDGARMMLACVFDGNPCNPGPNPVGRAPSGWVTVMRHKNYNNGDFQLGPTPFLGDGGGGAGDVHDNVVAYTWCTPFNGPAGMHNVKIKFASQPDEEDNPAVGNEVFLEGVHFFVDGSRIGDDSEACTRKVES